MKQLATAISTIIVSAFLFFGLSFLMSYVILDIAQLYSIPFILDFTISQVFASIVILSIARIKIRSKTDEDAEDQIVTAIVNIITAVLTISMLWGFCYIIKYLFL
jgi:hypothetical protein